MVSVVVVALYRSMSKFEKLIILLCTDAFCKGALAYDKL